MYAHFLVVILKSSPFLSSILFSKLLLVIVRTCQISVEMEHTHFKVQKANSVALKKLQTHIKDKSYLCYRLDINVEKNDILKNICILTLQRKHFSAQNVNIIVCIKEILKYICVVTHNDFCAQNVNRNLDGKMIYKHICLLISIISMRPMWIQMY